MSQFTKYYSQCCHNVVLTTCQVQHKYKVILQRCCNIVIFCCDNVAGMSFSQRCKNTTLCNVVFTLCVCWVYRCLTLTLSFKEYAVNMLLSQYIHQ